MGNGKISEDKYGEIVELYNSGLLQREIAEKYNVSRAAIERVLHKCEDYKPRILMFTDDDKAKICDLYLSGVSTVQIGKIFNCGNKPIARILEQYGIDRTGVGLRKYSLNEHYFDEIDTPNKAYIFGFFLADGSNYEPKQTISMSLQEEDGYILEEIRKEIGSGHPLEFLDYSNKHDGGYNYKNQYRLLMFSKHMSKVLHDKGMPQNKSLILKWPTFLRDDLYSHMLRGIIDGDGHISPTNYLVGLTSTEDFCVGAKQYLEDKLGIQCHITDASCHNGITRNLYIRTKNNVTILLNYIYQDAEMYLKRKHDVYISKYCNNDINNTLINVAS